MGVLGAAFSTWSRGRQTLTLWEASFLPQHFQELVSKAKAVGAQDVGGEIPLVASAAMVFDGTRPEIPTTLPRSWIPATGLGIVLMCLFGALGWFGRRRVWARFFWGLLSGVWGLVVGLLGAVLALLHFFTNHRIAWHNENFFLCAPWAIAMLPYGLVAIFGVRKALKGMMWLSGTGLLLAVAGLLLKEFAGFNQENLDFVLIVGPAWLGLTVGAVGLFSKGKA